MNTGTASNLIKRRQIKISEMKPILTILIILAIITLGSMIAIKESNDAIIAEMKEQGFSEIILTPIIISSCRFLRMSKTSNNHIFSYSALRDGKQEKGEVAAIDRLFYYEVKICDD